MLPSIMLQVAGSVFHNYGTLIAALQYHKENWPSSQGIFPRSRRMERSAECINECVPVYVPASTFSISEETAVLISL